jgi:RNA polymerase sigma-70 factor (ECF subfamily)
VSSRPQFSESSQISGVSISVLAEADDATLSRALCDGSAQAQRVAWNRFSPMVRRLVRRSLGPEFDAEDVVQEVFLCLFQKIGTLREPAALRGFVMSIAVLTVRTTLRSEMRRRKLRRWFGVYREAEPPAIHLVPEDSDSREALKRFYRILDCINPRDRTAFMLRFVEGLSVADAAAALDVSVPTVRRCFTRAWERFTLLASRDPFLADYLAAHRERGESSD